MTFQSDATDLVGGVNDTNKASDVFVRDLRSGQTQLVSATPDGKIGNGRLFQPLLSPDGRYVAFLSAGERPVEPTPAAGRHDDGRRGGNLYVRDMQTQTTRLIDVSFDGKASNGFATGRFLFSPDGKTLAFTDSSTDLTSTPPATPPRARASPAAAVLAPEYIYLHDLASGTTTAVNVSREGTSRRAALPCTGGLGAGLQPRRQATGLHHHGRRLDGQCARQHARRRAVGGGLARLVPLRPRPVDRHDVAGQRYARRALAGGISSSPFFSPDGDRLAFLSSSTGLTHEPAGAASSDPPGFGFIQNLFVRDLGAGTTTLASVTTGKTLSAGTVGEMTFSPDGRSLAFVSTGTDLTADAAEAPPSTP